MTSTEQICQELINLGYAAEPVQFHNFSVDNGLAVVFEYPIDVGRYRNCNYKIAISFQESGYPEYPPHFLHILNAPQLHYTAHSEHYENSGKWSTYSVPPNDFWDQLTIQDKNMKAYLNRHVRRFWDQA